MRGMVLLSLFSTLLVQLIASASLAETVRCQYEVSSKEFGILVFDLADDSIFVHGHEGYVMMEKHRDIVCGADQSDFRPKSCQAEQTLSPTELQWYTVCQRETGNNVWRELSEAMIKVDLKTGEGVYHCKSLLNENSSRRYFALTKCKKF